MFFFVLLIQNSRSFSYTIILPYCFYTNANRRKRWNLVRNLESCSFIGPN